MKQKPERYSNGHVLLFLVVLSFVFHWPGLRTFFSLDDLQFLLRAAGIDEAAGGFRRVISTRWFFAAGWALFGTRAWLYHLVVLILHAANACVLYLLARRLNLRQAAAFSASMLFAVAHVSFLPLHWISGIQEVTVTLFALFSAYFFIGRNSLSLIASLLAGLASLCCKEGSFLLLPALALVLPATAKRKWILGTSGVLVGFAVLVLSGSLSPRPRGDPYETAFGANILWNLLTYSAWLFQFWKYYPDKTPRVDPQMAGIGLVLPVLIFLVAWRIRKARGPIARASVVFILTLLPVLPLVRHSYFYYLYLPLIPFWILTGAYLGSLSRRRVSAGVLVAIVCLSFVHGVRHRRAEIAPGVLEDPILRYAAATENAVNSIRAKGDIKPGAYLIVEPSNTMTIDLRKGLAGLERNEPMQFSLVQQALLGGKALRLFFPAMESVEFEDEMSVTPGWQEKHIYLAYMVGMMEPLGFGDEGRLALIRLAISKKSYERAKRELLVMLEAHPGDPKLLFALGSVAAAQRDSEGVEWAIQKLEAVAADGDSTGIAGEALRRLRQ